MENLDFVLAILVQNLKGTVILITNVKKVSDVVQTIVWLHMDLKHTQIVVMRQQLEMRIFAQLMNLVEQMKVTVIPMMNAKAIYFVDQTIVQFHFFKYQMSALVLVVILTGKVITPVMIKTTIVDVNGMEETVAVVMLTQFIVQLVSV